MLIVNKSRHKKGPAEADPKLLEVEFKQSSENGDVFQQRNDANDDDDNASDLFRARIHRQHADEIEHENDDEKRDQEADQNTGCHLLPALLRYFGNRNAET